MIRHLRRTDYVRMPWKNGFGVTEQIEIIPPSAHLGNFMARVSIARVERDGPFSLFPGYRRVVIVGEGDGLRLQRGAAQIELRPFAPLELSGDEPITAALISGPIVDFNVITHTLARAERRVIALGAEMEIERGIVVCARGAMQCGEVQVARWDTVMGLELRLRPLEPETVIFHVRLSLPA